MLRKLPGAEPGPARVPFGALAASAVFFVLAALFVFLRPLLPIDETRYLAVAWEMWQSGTLVVPHLNGDIYPDKPPLLFWLINLIWAITGHATDLARLISPFFGAISVVLTAALGRQLWPSSSDTPRLAAWVLATTGVFLVFASLTTFDALLTASTLVALIGFVRLRRAPGWSGILIAAIGIAVGILAKGPVIALHVMPVVLAMPWWAGDDRPRAGRWYAMVLAVLLVAVALVLLWLTPALLSGDEQYRNQILWQQHAGRIRDSFAHLRPFWFYAVLLPFLAWPWGWSRRFVRGVRQGGVMQDEGIRFCVAWLFGSLLVFSIVSGKQPHYVLPELAAIALLVSRIRLRAREAAPMQRPERARAALLLAAVLYGLCVAAALPWATPELAAKELTVPHWAILAGGAVLVMMVVLESTARTAFVRWAAVGPLAVLMMHVFLSPVLFRQFDTRVIADDLEHFDKAGVAVFDYHYQGEFNYAASLHHAVTELRDREALDDWAVSHPGGGVLARMKLVDNALDEVASFHFRGRHYWLFRVNDGAGHMSHHQPDTGDTDDAVLY